MQCTQKFVPGIKHWSGHGLSTSTGLDRHGAGCAVSLVGVMKIRRKRAVDRTADYPKNNKLDAGTQNSIRLTI